jgi:hypothetical protein
MSTSSESILLTINETEQAHAVVGHGVAKHQRMENVVRDEGRRERIRGDREEG